MTAAGFDVEEMVGDLGRLINVESPSREVDAVTRSANVLAELIRERLGSDPDLVAGPVGPHVDWRGGVSRAC